jgi:ribonuclease T1
VRRFHVLLFVAATLFAPLGAARDVPTDGIATVRLEQLPAEAQETLRLIKRAGPYPYRKDGTVFGNREKRLPRQPRGYYTEYTVKTPQVPGRGPRRIVAGGGPGRDPATGGEYYYTEDHYNTFRRIIE